MRKIVFGAILLGLGPSSIGQEVSPHFEVAPVKPAGPQLNGMAGLARLRRLRLPGLRQYGKPRERGRLRRKNQQPERNANPPPSEPLRSRNRTSFISR
jgi:hypothetical protein